MTFNGEVHQAFSLSAQQYEKHAIAQREIGERLFGRLHYLAMKPRTILDLGCGSGYFLKKLKSLYPDACVVGLDFSAPMLEQAKLRDEAGQFIQAKMSALPFEDRSFDLVFANQVTHWADHRLTLFHEIHRVLHPEGCFFFSTLGPDTFKELRDAFRQADGYEHVHPFADLHVLGDELVQARFLDPVMDREDLCLHYSSLQALLDGLKAQGVRNINTQRNPGLTGRTTWSKFKQVYASLLTEKGYAPLSYEIIYGHAWKGQVHIGKKGPEVLIPAVILQ